MTTLPTPISRRTARQTSNRQRVGGGRIKQLERENAELIKFIEQCSEDRYARVACREWVRKHKKCSKP